ncbi:tripartite tricarboxylate transporter substrate binding protein [bacterium]|nr:tripartite tricarboxylate transporter substrate binding protein [bacterium]
MSRKKLFLVLVVVAFAATLSVPAFAEYPVKTVKLITHSSAGGGTDRFLRQAVGYLGPIMGVDFVVENVRGGSGAKAMAALSAAPADGSTFYGSTPTYISTSLLSKPEFTYKDLDPVVCVFLDPMVAYTAVDSKFKTLKEAVDFARDNPGKGTWGTGTPTELGQEIIQRLKRIANVDDVKVVSFEGGGDLMLNVLGGRLDFGMGEPGEILSQLQEGKLRILATFTDERVKGLDAPTAREQGYDIVLTKFRGIVGPKGLPENVVKAWEEAIPKLLALPEYKAVYEGDYLIPNFVDQKSFRPYVEQRAADIEAYFKGIGIIK